MSAPYIPYLSISMMNGFGFCLTVCSGSAPTNFRFFNTLQSEMKCHYRDIDNGMATESLNQYSNTVSSDLPLESKVVYLSSNPSMTIVRRKSFIRGLSWRTKADVFSEVHMYICLQIPYLYCVKKCGANDDIIRLAILSSCRL